MSPQKRAQLLHLEDDAKWIREVKLSLGKDYEVQPATSLRQAVELFHDTVFDLVIVDIDLITKTGADEEGFRLIKGLQKAGILPGNRVVVLSAFAHLEERTRRAFRDYGVWDVIPKDKYSAEELKTEIAEAIRSPKYYGE